MAVFSSGAKRATTEALEEEVNFLQALYCNRYVNPRFAATVHNSVQSQDVGLHIIFTAVHALA